MLMCTCALVFRREEWIQLLLIVIAGNPSELFAVSVITDTDESRR